jgi:hypothetical protein
VRFYRIREDTEAGYTGEISAASKWGLPGVMCPACGNTWANAAIAYPCVDLSQHPHRQAGVQGLKGCKPELRFRQKKNPPDLGELQLEPQGLLHADCLPPRPPPCPRCGRDGFQLPEHLILDKASLPTHTDVFRVANFSTVLVGSERFKEAVQRLGHDGLLFLELPLR